MSTKYSLREVALLMHSYGIKCNIEKVNKWIKEGKIKGKVKNDDYEIEESEIYEFLEAYRWEGTAYEKGIDDNTKISRLEEEISENRKRINNLEKENKKLIEQLSAFGVMPF